jgi:hypothetical protein
MTSWQIFALSSPVIIVAVMWLQGLTESHFELSSSSQKTSATSGDGVSSYVERSKKKAVSGYFVPGTVLAALEGLLVAKHNLSVPEDPEGIEQEALRILAEAVRLEAVKVETEPETETSSAPIESAGSCPAPRSLARS